jgi:hypothetical protein
MNYLKIQTLFVTMTTGGSSVVALLLTVLYIVLNNNLLLLITNFNCQLWLTRRLSTWVWSAVNGQMGYTWI